MLCRLILKWAVVLHVADLSTMGRKSVMRMRRPNTGIKKMDLVRKLVTKRTKCTHAHLLTRPGMFSFSLTYMKHKSIKGACIVCVVQCRYWNVAAINKL